VDHNSDLGSSIPSRSDWGDFEDGSETYFAYRKFGEKSLDELKEFYIENPTSCFGYLQHSPDIPFRYYILGFEIALLSPDLFAPGGDAACVASCFLGILKWEMKQSPQRVLPVMEHLMPLAAYVAANQSKYDADVEIFGSFQETFSAIQSIYHGIQNK
jgi:hypothetical protein